MYYLLLKTSKHLTSKRTILKYLCKHEGSRESCFKYCGSGKYWKLHLKKYGKEHSTNILFETTNRAELKYAGKWFSNEFNIVNDSAWANLGIENGWGGDFNSGRKLSKLTKRKISQNNGRYWKGKHLSSFHRERLSAAKKGKKCHFFGKFGKDHPRFKKSPWNKGLIGAQTAWNKGKQWPTSIKRKISQNRKGKGIGEANYNFGKSERMRQLILTTRWQKSNYDSKEPSILSA